MFITQTKTFVTTKAELLDKYVNEWIQNAEASDEIEGYILTPITISYTDINSKGAYMIAQQIQYSIRIPDSE